MPYSCTNVWGISHVESVKTAYYVLVEGDHDLSDEINDVVKTEISVFDGKKTAVITYTDNDGILIDKIKSLNDTLGVKVISSIRVLND